MYRILYKGDVIHESLSYEECAEALLNLSEEFYDSDGMEFDPNYIQLEEI
jgi:hypothetical protein